MAKRGRSSLALSAEHARQALAILVQEGKLRASEVRKALQRRDRLIRDLRAKLASLEAGVVKAGRRVLKDGFFPMAGRRKTAKRPVARRKPRISPATRKVYQMQGRYMAVLRPLSKVQRAKVKAVREKSGVRAAIAAARRPRPRTGSRRDRPPYARSPPCYAIFARDRITEHSQHVSTCC